MAVLPIDADGSLHPASAFVQDTGSGPNPRQAGPHAHSFNVSPDNRFAIEAEFGLDRLFVYRFDAAAGTLAPAQPPFVALRPASAPRHFTFRPRGDGGVLAERDRQHGDHGPRVCEGDGLLPRAAERLDASARLCGQEHRRGECWCTSASGPEFLCTPPIAGTTASAVFAVDDAGRLSLLAHVPSGGRSAARLQPGSDGPLAHHGQSGHEQYRGL